MPILLFVELLITGNINIYLIKKIRVARKNKKVVE